MLDIGKIEKNLIMLYGEEMLPYETERYKKAAEKFAEHFGENDGVRIFTAPGRTEIGGNHTDHNRGKVVAAAIGPDALAFAVPSEDSVVEIVSEGFEISPVDISDLSVREDEKGSTESLIRGVAAGLHNEGAELRGFKAYVTSDVLSGSGLSSSAAFEVLIGNIFAGLYNVKVNDVKIAQIAQYAENEYFGKPCGLMDQMASSVGGFITIDFEDTENPVINRVSVDFSDKLSLYIVDTKGSHADLTDDYAAIPKEMRSVAAVFGKSELRDITKETLWANISEVREKCGDRAVSRALHFFDENERAEKEFEALSGGDISGFLRLVNESGESSYRYLQNVFSSKNTREQALVLGLYAASEALAGEGASRVHGGGFAGTVQCFVPFSREEKFVSAMEHLFGKGNCRKMYIRPVGGYEVNGN